MKIRTLISTIIESIQSDDEFNLDLKNAWCFFLVDVSFEDMRVYVKMYREDKAFTREGYFYLKDYKTGNNFNFRKLRKDLRDWLKVIEFDIYFNRFQ